LEDNEALDLRQRRQEAAMTKAANLTAPEFTNEVAAVAHLEASR
jgi:hypothetical protein